MITDFSYCTGNNCPLKDLCIRFIESFESATDWVMPSYNELKEDCDNYVKANI